MTTDSLPQEKLGRIVRPADFERVLGTTIRLRSAHFAIHHLAGRPLPTKPARKVTIAAVDAPENAHLSTELSTAPPMETVSVVDDLRGAAIETKPDGHWLGLVVPKRHARRAVTRTLVKRQIRVAVTGCVTSLEPGLWVVRQRAPFDVALFRSAASDALKDAVRTELGSLMARAARGERDSSRPRAPARFEDRKSPASSRSAASSKPPEA